MKQMHRSSMNKVVKKLNLNDTSPKKVGRSQSDGMLDSSFQSLQGEYMLDSSTDTVSKYLDDSAPSIISISTLFLYTL